MLQIVAEKTGYPVDMLNPGLDLEGDLGIDSIKRVEILAAVDERAPGMSKLGSVQHERDAPRSPKSSTTLQAQQADAPLLAAFAHDGCGCSGAHAIDLTSMMLQVVAEKTGYPVDMLNLGMDLEADLGVDSIKRVEILAAVDERVPGLPKLDRGRMSALHTLAEIVDYLQGQQATVDAVARRRRDGSTDNEIIDAPCPTLISVGSASNACSGASDRAWRSLACTVAAMSGSPATPCLADHLAAELRARRINVRMRGSSSGWRDSLHRSERTARGRGRGQPSRSIVKCSRMRESWLQGLRAERGLFVTVQDTGGAFGLADMDPRRAWLAGLPALVKTAALEWPKASLKAIDLERGGRAPEAIAIAIADELLEGGGEIEVALPASGGRYTLRSGGRGGKPGRGR